MQSQPASRFFRDHLGLQNVEEIALQPSIMQLIWNKTRKRGLFFILNGITDCEIIYIISKLYDEEMTDRIGILDSQGIILTERLWKHFSGKAIVFDGASVLDDALRVEIFEVLKRAYERFR